MIYIIRDVFESKSLLAVKAKSEKDAIKNVPSKLKREWKRSNKYLTLTAERFSEIEKVVENVK